ncbi:hypothetical protein [Vagococcus salmoninarum]|uniref:hypothetical protein n=1 Tax=Vagococcus salmoninarum TaxID=2739 RepID=UPI0028D8FA10|nr:hypothetical protein [Vagococcus salmoninarum]
MINLLKAYYTLFTCELNEDKKQLLKSKMIAFYIQNKEESKPLDPELSVIIAFIFSELAN